MTTTQTPTETEIQWAIKTLRRAHSGQGAKASDVRKAERILARRPLSGFPEA